MRFSLDPSIQYFTAKNYKHKLMTRWLHVDNNVDNNQSNKSENLYAEYQIQKTFESLGMSFNAGIVGSSSYINAKLYSDTVFNSFNLASYVQFEQKLFERLNLSAGVRYEYFSLTGPNSISGKSIKKSIRRSTSCISFGCQLQTYGCHLFKSQLGTRISLPYDCRKIHHYQRRRCHGNTES
ncbi:MAG: TonB-dependent receptor [Saprospiraceae bacterium]|nr:TonB-dependent receptor [Candidatus Vicinibacter affinis]